MSDSPAGQSHVDVARAVAGDRGAFQRLVRSTARLVFTTILLEVRDPHLADDLTQDTFLRAWRAIGTLHEPARFNAWLLGIARSACIDSHRARTRKKRTGNEADRNRARDHASDVGSVPDPKPGPFERLSQSDDRERLIDALGSLPHGQREVLSMRYLGGADYATIAASLNLTDGALRGLLSRGLATLREKMVSLSPEGRGLG